MYEHEGTSDDRDFSAQAESTFRKLKDFCASFMGKKAKRERARIEELFTERLFTEQHRNKGF